MTADTRQWQVQRLTLECRQGNIAMQVGIEAVVNAANAELRIGGGVAGAIHRAAGPELERECRPMAPIRPGEAVITGAHGLPNKYVIHCLGPVYGRDEPAGELLASCYQHALRLGDEAEISSIAFPAISTGAFGYPMEPAARIAFRTVLEEAPGLRSVRHVRFVLFDRRDLALHERVAQELVEARSGSD